MHVLAGDDDSVCFFLCTNDQFLSFTPSSVIAASCCVPGKVVRFVNSWFVPFPPFTCVLEVEVKLRFFFFFFLKRSTTLYIKIRHTKSLVLHHRAILHSRILWMYIVNDCSSSWNFLLLSGLDHDCFPRM